MAVNVLVTHFGLQTSRHNNLESDTCWKGTLLESAYFGLQTNRQEIILNLIPVGGHNMLESVDRSLEFYHTCKLRIALELLR